ncbi:hypothetical protein C5167_036001 [Papaver somniferum]|nr:hypothetical protein C5167_036001 [Papaver somniferum]
MLRRLQGREWKSICMTSGHNMVYAMCFNMNAASRRQQSSWRSVHLRGDRVHHLCSPTIGGMLPFVIWRAILQSPESWKFMTTISGKSCKEVTLHA